jgi:hypothetical protein
VCSSDLQTLTNIQVNMTADAGVTVNGAEMQTILALAPSASTILQWTITTGTADAGVGENTITASAYNLVSSTDTVKSATGQGFS